MQREIQDFTPTNMLTLARRGTPTKLIGPKAGMRDITPTTYFKRAGGARRITPARRLELESMILL